MKIKKYNIKGDLMKKIAVDISMFFAIILEFLSLPILAHEIIGIGLFVLVILHLYYNKHYFKAIPKGKYNLKRTLDLIINIGLLISLLITIISGIFTSQESLKDLKIRNYKISHLHKSFSIISLIFLVLHLATTHKKLLRMLNKNFLSHNNSLKR